MTGPIRISVVMPSMNEEKAIAKMIEEIRKHTAQFETEIVLVDSSKDRTAQIAEELGARVIRQQPQGHGIALRSAIRAAKNDIVITSDCDNTYPMDFIPKLVRLIVDDGFDMVSCNRMTKALKQEMPILNKFGNWLFAFLVRNLYGIPVHDVTTGMFAMKRELVEGVSWETNYSLPCELIVRSHLRGAKLKEIDIPYRIRIGEVTLNRWRSGKAYVRCILNYRFGLNIDPKWL